MAACTYLKDDNKPSRIERMFHCTTKNLYHRRRHSFQPCVPGLLEVLIVDLSLFALP